MNQYRSTQSTPSVNGRLQEQVHSQCFESHVPLRGVLSCIEKQHKVLILMRGVPGSGKSHLAKELKTRGQVFSTDDFFYRPNGTYQFDARKLTDYHAQNFNRVRDALEQHVNPIIVDNTNVFAVHMEPYASLAVKKGYEVYFVEPNTPWKFNADECFRAFCFLISVIIITQWKFDANECARRNSHGVPLSSIERMLDEYEGKVNLKQLIHPTKVRITVGHIPASRPTNQPAVSSQALSRPFLRL